MGGMVADSQTWGVAVKKGLGKAGAALGGKVRGVGQKAGKFANCSSYPGSAPKPAEIVGVRKSPAVAKAIDMR